MAEGEEEEEEEEAMAISRWERGMRSSYWRPRWLAQTTTAG